jgi:nucleotide-binding universal stress UspA family protein
VVAGQVAAEVWDYAQVLGELLGVRVAYLNTMDDTRALEEQGGWAKYELIVLGNPTDPLLQKFLALRTQGRGAVLIAQHPHWPLKRILLIACGEPSDSAATEWTLRLALRAGSTVAVLAIVPPVSAMYGQMPSMEQGLPALLTSETALGRRMQQVAGRLVEEGVEGTLRLRQGPPEWQVRREITDGEYDLIVVADQPCRWWRRWLEGDLVAALLHWADRPVLIAGSGIARSPITRTPARAEDPGQGYDRGPERSDPGVGLQVAAHNSQPAG